jgi:hypothetical protein
MFKRSLTLGDIFLILINLLPLAGVWFLDWEPRQMFLIYCIETIIIGLYNVLKMAVAGFHKRKDVWNSGNGAKPDSQPAWFFILFFIIHYGFFVFVQVNIFAGAAGWHEYGIGFGFFKAIPFLLADYSKLVLYIFIAVYGVKMMSDFIMSGAYKTTSLGMLMFQPYARILVQQFVVIAGSMFLQFNAGKIFMLIFGVVKIYAEVFLNFERLLETADKKNQSVV